jgi:hypothetical protein
MRIVFRLILPGKALLGGELLAAPRALQATPLQFPRLLGAPWALHVSAIGPATAVATPLQSPRKTKPAERSMTNAINGRLLSIRSRIATVTHVATTSVAQIEFAASQKRQEVTKLDEKEGDEALKTPLCTEAGTKLLMQRLTLVATLIIFLSLYERIRFSLQAITKSSAALLPISQGNAHWSLGTGWKPMLP